MAPNRKPESVPNPAPRHTRPVAHGTQRARPELRAPALLWFLLALLGMLAPAQAQSLEWTQRTLSPRTAHAMVYDAARGVTVLFGGYNIITGNNGETWEWNGTAWTQRMVSGPSPRYLHAMVYDAARGVTVLFGGNNSVSGYNGETWEWNGTAWTDRKSTRLNSSHIQKSRMPSSA